MTFNYRFPAVKGLQAGKDYYITMVPLKLLAKLFPSEDDIVLPEFRAQRRINESRIPEIKKYIIENRNSYVFSALSASIDGDFYFFSESNSEIGILEIPMDSVFLINDGQHRKAAIEAALQEDDTLANETISIVFFKDRGLQRSQQMFTDLNKHAVKTSNSLSTLYDYRDSLAVATKEVIDAVPFFKKFTDKERDILGKNSSNLFTLNNIYKANQKIMHAETIGDHELNYLINYWNSVADNIIEWNEVIEHKLTKKDLRENYIVTLAITLNSLGKLGRFFFENPEIKMENHLFKLKNIDWLRASDNWRGRVIRENGKVSNSDESVNLTCAKIKQLIGLKLSKEEVAREKALEKK